MTDTEVNLSPLALRILGTMFDEDVGTHADIVRSIFGPFPWNEDQQQEYVDSMQELVDNQFIEEFDGKH